MPGDPSSAAPVTTIQFAMFEGYVLSGWWRRAGARTIDIAIVVLVLFGLELAIGFKTSQLLGHDALHLSAIRHFERLMASLIVTAVYYPLVMWRTNGATLGKRALGIRVIRTDHEPMSLVRAAWREVFLGWGLFYLFQIIPRAGSTLGAVVVTADNFWPVFDRQHRALHDVAAGTRVVFAPGR